MIASELPHAIGRDGRSIEGERNALLPWWSITKTVLAAAVLRLVDRGTLSIDDRYEDAPYTIRQLLQHTSGLNTYGGPYYQAAVANGDPVWSVEELLERRNVRQLLFRPGEGWAYSNIGYLFVRRLIEASTGSDLDQALAALVFGPMRIKGTRIALGPGDMARTLWGNPTNYDPRWVYHGLLIGPPSDAVQFLRSLFAPEFLSRQVLMSMQDRHVLAGEVPGRPWLEIGYGLGLMMGNMRAIGRAVGHSGVGHDTVSSLYLFPDYQDHPIIAVFAKGTDEGATEREAVRLAIG